jgi:hypothetical protein
VARSWDAPVRAQQAGRSTPHPEHRSSYRGRSLEVAGVEKPQPEIVFEHTVDRLPVDACSLHTHQRHLERSQPIPEQQKSLWVVVANSLISWRGPSPSPVAILTHAVTDALCTSSPAHRSTSLSKSSPFAQRASSAAKRSLFCRESGVRALIKATIRGTPEAPASHR